MIGIIIFTSLAFVLGAILVVLNSILNKDASLISEIEDRLPGYNCGACGFATCLGMAEKIIEDEENLKKCRPLKKGQEKELREFLEKLNKS